MKTSLKQCDYSLPFCPNVMSIWDGSIILLLGVWSTDKQHWHLLEVVRNAKYQPVFGTELEFAFQQDLQATDTCTTSKLPVI